MAKRFGKITHRLFYTLLLLAGLFALLLIILEQDLPDVATLTDFKIQVPLRVYTSDHKLLAEYGAMRRSPIELRDVPPQLLDAIIATEDKRYWEHSGIDILGLGRAAVQLVITGRKTQGGSTITMQVARNFFLSSKKTYIRKIREILLAMKIDHELDKHTILGLYVNKVYLGYRAYGFSAAANLYYGKPLNQLTLAQLAMLAGLPKAPSSINPLVNPVAAKERRSHVLLNMYEQHYITKEQYDQASSEPLNASYHALSIGVDAPYIGEMVRDAIVKQYGEEAYTKGIEVITTINSRQQLAANKAVRNAILNYSIRHGYAGPITNISDPSLWLSHINHMSTVGGLMPAVITGVSDQSATALIQGGNSITIPWQGIQWAGAMLTNGWRGPTPANAGQVIKVGDVVYLNHNTTNDQWSLSQLPRIQAALVALNPVNGGITALVGGFDFHQSKFNRATDALRQPGSGFKPFIYSAALNKGFTLASIVNDAPIVANSQSEAGVWRPQNDSRTFGGPTRLRVALAKSLNLVSIRLLQMVGLSYTIDYINNMGFDQQPLPHELTLALGVNDITPLQMAAGLATFANSGYQVKPYFIDSIIDANNNNKILFQANPTVACETCVDNDPAPATPPANTSAPTATKNMPTPVYATRVITPDNAYQITSAMQSVIQDGTGRAAKVLGRHDLAGKTGSTQDLRDAWFSGFNSDIVTVTWLGFDQPQSTHEHGAQGALPMWIDFMRQALANSPEHTMPRPANIVTVKIDPVTGLLARPGQSNAIFEIFPQDLVPKMHAPAQNSNQNDLLTASTNASPAAAKAPTNGNSNEESGDENSSEATEENPPSAPPTNATPAAPTPNNVAKNSSEQPLF